MQWPLLERMLVQTVSVTLFLLLSVYHAEELIEVSTTLTGPSAFHAEVSAAADFVNYYETYSYISEQKRMLSDDVRMQAYFRAISENEESFRGKVVLDVGAGSGILSMWAAKAGAAKVYAVEYTSMAQHARRLVHQNGLDSVVEVIQSSIEELVLPEQVDVIISEWMGMVLLRESMLDSVIRARDRFLKPGGTLWPSGATLYGKKLL